MSRTREAQVVVRRGGEVLVAHRTKDGHWHSIAGGVEAGESDAEAAARELEEETGLAADVGAPRHSYVYDDVTVTCFLVDAPPGWEPRLDHEHDGYRWCSVADARALMHWADAADALVRLASQ